MSEIPDVIIHGAFDSDNFGDVLLADLTARHVNLLGYRACVSGSNDAIVSQLGGDVTRLRSRWQARTAKALVYSGGGYWGEQPNSHLKWHLSRGKKHLPIGYLFKLLGKPYACVGAGFGPLRYSLSRKLVTTLLNGTDYLALRDAESRDYFHAYGGDAGKVEVTADMALVISPGMIKERMGTRKPLDFPEGAIGIHANESLESGRQKKFLETLRPLLMQHPERKFVVFQDGGSNKPSRYQQVKEIASYLGTSVHAIEYVSPWQLCDALSRMSVVITNKLHVGIVSAALGKVVLALPNHPKTTRFYRQLGRSELCFESADIESGRFQGALHAAVDGGIPPIRVPDDILKLSARNYDLITRLVA